MVSPVLTSAQLGTIKGDIKHAFYLDEVYLHLPEFPRLGDDAVIVSVKSSPKIANYIFGNIDFELKRRIKKIFSLKNECLAVNSTLEAYVLAEKSAGLIANTSIELRTKDETSVLYSIARSAPISPVRFCEFNVGYSSPIPGIYHPGRSDTGIAFLHIHGGPHAKTTAYNFDPFAQYLASFGMVVDVNYPGSTGLGRSYESYSDGNWAGVADILANIAMRITKIGKKVVAVGTSFGAYATMKIANQYPDLLSGAIAINGIYDLHQGLKEEAISGEQNIIEWTHQFGGSDGGENLHFNSVIFGAPAAPTARVSCPTLLVSGGKDTTCYPAQTEKMFSVITLSTPAYHLHSKEMGHSHNSADNIVITSIIGPFLHAHVSNKIIFEPFSGATARLAANGKDLDSFGLSGWSLKSNTPRRNMLDAELTVLGIH